MKKCVFSIFSIFICFSTAHAQDNLKNFWQCTVSDQVNPPWVGRAETQRDAINMAWRTCKQQSSHSSQCEAARENCQEIVDGKIYRPAWRCMAFDGNTRYFMGEKQYRRSDAFNSAMNRCQRASFVPKTCLVQLMTCKDV